jgi:hypothetical protein
MLCHTKEFRHTMLHTRFHAYEMYRIKKIKRDRKLISILPWTSVVCVCVCVCVCVLPVNGHQVHFRDDGNSHNFDSEYTYVHIYIFTRE